MTKKKYEARKAAAHAAAKKAFALVSNYNYQSAKILDRLCDVAEQMTTGIELENLGSLVQAIAARNAVRDRIELLNAKHRVRVKLYPGVAD
jgi:hypothetical protein